MRSYQYRNQVLLIIHTTSVPQTDEAAIAYAAKVNTWGLGRVMAITRREEGEREFKAFYVAQAS